MWAHHRSGPGLKDLILTAVLRLAMSVFTVILSSSATTHPAQIMNSNVWISACVQIKTFPLDWFWKALCTLLMGRTLVNRHLGLIWKCVANGTYIVLVDKQSWQNTWKQPSPLFQQNVNYKCRGKKRKTDRGLLREANLKLKFFLDSWNFVLFCFYVEVVCHAWRIENVLSLVRL